MEVHPGITAIIILGPRLVGVPRLEALQAGGSLNQAAIDGEVLVRQQAAFMGVGYHLVEQLLSHLVLKQALAVLGEDGGVEAGF